MLKSTTDLVFVNKNEGVGKNSNKPFKMFKFANPKNFENFTLNADLNKQFVNFSSGDLVKIEVAINDFFGKPGLLVTDIIPAGK